MGLVILSAVLFGTTGTALAQVTGPVDPLSAGILRLLIGGGLLVLIAYRSLSSTRGSGRVLFVGAVAVAVYQLGFFWAVTDTGVAAGTLITIGISPIASRLIGSMVGHAAPPRAWFAAAGILLTGLSVMILGGYDDIHLSATGVVVALGAGIAFAAYTECGARALSRGASPDGTMGALFFGAGLLTSPLLLWRDLDIVSTGRGVVVLGHLAVVTLTLAYVAFGRGLRRLPPSSVTMLTMVEPVVATVLSSAVLNERLSVIGWVGAALVVLGLPLVGRASQPELRASTRTTVRT